jgi:hypothetical protein
MKVKVEGYRYKLTNFENNEQEEQTIQFIHKIPIIQAQGITQIITLANGTTTEEVIEVLINRLTYLQNKFPCKENTMAITKLEESLMWLNKRTADRVKRNVEGKYEN